MTTNLTAMVFDHSRQVNEYNYMYIKEIKQKSKLMTRNLIRNPFNFRVLLFNLIFNSWYNFFIRKDISSFNIQICSVVKLFVISY